MQTTKSCPTGQNCLKLSKNFTFIWLQTLTGANLKHWQAASSAVTLMQHWQVLCWVEKQHYFIFWFCLVCFCSLNVISKGRFLHDFFFFSNWLRKGTPPLPQRFTRPYHQAQSGGRKLGSLGSACLKCRSTSRGGRDLTNVTTWQPEVLLSSETGGHAKTILGVPLRHNGL